MRRSLFGTASPPCAGDCAGPHAGGFAPKRTLRGLRVNRRAADLTAPLDAPSTCDMKATLWTLAALLALPVANSALAASAAKRATCDRTCLSGFVTQYLDALTAHDPKRLTVTSNVRFTENGVAIPLGEALWVTIERLGSYRVDYLDSACRIRREWKRRPDGAASESRRWQDL